MQRGPADRVGEEVLDLLRMLRREVAERLGLGEHVLPGRQRMHGEAVLFVHLTALWIDVVVEDHEDVAQLRTSLAQRARGADLRAAVGGEVVDQQATRAFGQVALDLRMRTPADRLLAHIDHRQVEPVCDPRGERNARSLGAGDHVDRRTQARAQQSGCMVHQQPSIAGMRHQPPAVDIDRAGPASGVDERLPFIDQHCLEREQRLRGVGGDGQRVGRERRQAGRRWRRGVGHGLEVGARSAPGMRIRAAQCNPAAALSGAAMPARTHMPSPAACHPRRDGR